jgi:signal transduction histidine kinase
MPALGQQFNFTIKHYNTESGLPQNTIVNIAADKNGFVWLTTENGLVRFDGQSFRTFNLGNTPALKTTDRMRLIYTDTSGKIFTSNANYDVFEVKGINEVVAIDTMAGKRMMIAPNAKQVNHDDFLKSFENLRKQMPIINDALFQQTIYKISEEEIYTWADNSDVCYLNKKGVGKRLSKNNRDKHYIVNDTLYLLDGDGRFYAFYKADHPVALGITGDILSDKQYKPSLAGLKILAIEKGAVLKLGDNYYQVERKAKSLHTSLMFGNLSLPNVNCMAYDKTHRQYLLGTLADGFYIVKKQDFLNIKHAANSQTGENFDIFTRQILLKNDRIVSDFGLVFDKDGSADFSFGKPFSGSLNDVDGSIWYEADGFITKAGSHDMVPVVRIPVADNSGIRYIIQDPVSKKLWCSSPNEIFTINLQTNKLDLLEIPNLGKQEITFLQSKDSNTFWLGTNDGLYVFQLRQQALHKIPGSDKKIIRYVLEDKAAKIDWVSTYGQGPFYIKNDSLTALPVDKAGNLLTPHYFIDDKKGFLWMPTNHGLFQVLKKDWLAYAEGRLKTVYYHYRASEDGFASNEFNGGVEGSFVVRTDGLVSMVSMKGLVWFYPDKVIADLPTASIFIDKIILDSKSIGTPATVKLPDSYVQLAVTVTTPYFGNKANLDIEYQIDGLNDKWNDVPENRVIVLAKLPHGKYELNLRVAAGFGGKYNYQKLYIQVSAAWYESWWFYMVAGLIAAVIVLLLVRWRIDSLLRRKKELENEVASRTASLNDTVENYKTINEQLEYAQQQLLDGDRVKEDIIAIILHDLWSPLNFIAATSGRMLQERQQFNPDQIFSYITTLNGSANNIVHLTEQLLKWMRSQYGVLKIDVRETPVNALLSEIAKLYKEIALQRGNTITIECAPNATTVTDPSILKLIVRNMVDNANKNTKNGHILLTYSLGSNNESAISVKDTGRGMGQEKIAEIIALAAQDSLKAGSLGFRFAFEFARLLDAQINIKSEVGSGTEISVVLPRLEAMEI